MHQFILLLSTIYALIITILTIGILILKSKTENEIKNISIIVAARNEENNISNLLEILSDLNYPKENYEIIIANDRSEDSTERIIRSYQDKYKNIKLVNIVQENTKLIGKKGALDQAINKSAYEYLVFTDADCLPTRNWLKEINKYWYSGVDFWAGYSPLLLKNPFISLLKNLERASIFAVTAGSFGINWGITCTARNMGYRKSVFRENNGFEGIGTIRSGDDDLLLQKLSKYIRKFSFLFSSDSIVWSKDRDDLKDQMNLETRRGSKWKHYTVPIKVLSLFVFIYYIFFLLGIILWGSGAISNNLMILIFAIKIIPEFLILFVFLIRIKMLQYLILFPIAELIYIPYFIFFAVKGTIGKYSWK